jgi:NAD(P)-dependent dehydrogenase (short-subunit alcohol dehydrogenase family)
LEITRQLLADEADWRVLASCRTPDETGALRALESGSEGRLGLLEIDVTEERTIEAAAGRVAEETSGLELILNVAGVLHGSSFGPEKKLGHVDPEALRAVFEVNTFGPLLVAKHFHTFLRHERRSVFASLSARVGSISDNRLGGWYAYRSSKAAQNMITKTLSIELGRLAPHAVVVGLHPGTVDTALSRPFQRNVPPGKLLPAQASASSLLQVLRALPPSATGQVFDYRGEVIPP